MKILLSELHLQMLFTAQGDKAMWYLVKRHRKSFNDLNSPHQLLTELSDTQATLCIL